MYIYNSQITQAKNMYSFNLEKSKDGIDYT